MGRTACTEPQCLYKGALYLLLTSKFQMNLLSPLTVSTDYEVTMREFLFPDMAPRTADGTAHSNHRETLKWHWSH